MNIWEVGRRKKRVEQFSEMLKKDNEEGLQPLADELKMVSGDEKLSIKFIQLVRKWLV